MSRQVVNPVVGVTDAARKARPARRSLVWTAILAATLASAANAEDVEVVQTSELRFGAFVAVTDGMVTVPPSGFAVYVNAVPTSGAAAAAARFEIKGDPSALVEIQLPSAPVQLRLARGQAMLQRFTLEPLGLRDFAALGAGRYRLRLDPGGSATADVGATLTFSNTGPEGVGAASFPVIVTYAR